MWQNFDLGKDFDQRIMEYFIKLIKKLEAWKRHQQGQQDTWKLRREAEHAKRALSSQHQVRVEIESLFDGVDFSEPLSCKTFLRADALVKRRWLLELPAAT
ncbi:hypothetical protein Drorol1_Dr00018477 [Drosera rotundifolia]